MMSSRSARDVALKDIVSVQLETFHEGEVLTAPERSASVERRVHFKIACTVPDHGSHDIEMPEFRLITVDRNL